MGNMRFKVGDRVRIKSLDWYNRYTNGTEVDCGAYPFTSDMKEFCGQERIIANVCQECYVLLGIDDKFVWTDEMIECKMEEETYDFLKTDKPYPTKPKVEDFLDMFNDTITLPEGYIFKDENGNVINATKIVLEKKKTEYPKTYEECCEIFQYNKNLKVYPPFNADIPNYDVLHLFDLLEALRKLIICRDTYWKIAGEEMGLGKPWEPDWEENSEKSIITKFRNAVAKFNTKEQYTFAFPTEEMRDAFYENFKEEIEICKELL